MIGFPSFIGLTLSNFYWRPLKLNIGWSFYCEVLPDNHQHKVKVKNQLWTAWLIREMQLCIDDDVEPLWHTLAHKIWILRPMKVILLEVAGATFCKKKLLQKRKNKKSIFVCCSELKSVCGGSGHFPQARLNIYLTSVSTCFTILVAIFQPRSRSQTWKSATRHETNNANSWVLTRK